MGGGKCQREYESVLRSDLLPSFAEQTAKPTAFYLRASVFYGPVWHEEGAKYAGGDRVRRTNFFFPAMTRRYHVVTP